MPEVAQVLKLLGFTTPFIYAAATYGFFHWLDKKASGPAKRAISGWLEPKEYDRAAIAAAVLELFDRVYTRPLQAWPAVLRSALITVTISILFVYELAGDPSEVHYFPSGLRGAAYGYYGESVRVIYFFIALGLNIISDYAALFVIRLWLNNDAPSPLKALLVGPAFGLALITSVIIVRDTVMSFALFYSMKGLPEWLALNTTEPVYIALSLSALAVHLWLPVFALCVGLVKGLNYIILATKQIQWFIKRGKDHPLDALGFVATPLMFLGAVAVQMLVSK